MTVVPLASTAAMRAFSVAPTLGNSSRIRAPVSWAARALDVAVLHLDLGAQLLQGPQVHVDGPGAEVVAAGQGDPGLAEAGQQGAEHHDAGPHRSTSS